MFYSQQFKIYTSDLNEGIYCVPYNTHEFQIKYISLKRFYVALVLPLTLFPESRVDEVQPGKLEEDWRSHGDYRHVYSLRAPAAALESSKTTDTLKQTKVARGQAHAQVQCYQGQQYRCLRNIRCEAMREWGGRACLTPRCQLLSPRMLFTQI